MTSKKQALKKGKVTNPTGKGGFHENPQNRGTGFWDSTKSVSYNYKKFLNMTEADFLAWGKQVPKNKKTMAQKIAYSNMINAPVSLKHSKEVTDRTEGRAPQHIDLTSKNKELTNLTDRALDDKYKEVLKNI